MDINQKRSKITMSLLKRFPDMDPFKIISRVAKEVNKYIKNKKS